MLVDSGLVSDKKMLHPNGRLEEHLCQDDVFYFLHEGIRQHTIIWVKPAVKAFIDHVISIPLHDIAIPLSCFRWEFNKGNFSHSEASFLHFDTYCFLGLRKYPIVF
ncbi:hypothetical protein GUJ93_ZPchr0014g47019 [Zizania palustris]|uniref:Uncharacterized protein n=1 Tax=Zizania palustris TaxID=103762 RepID=A0A8J5TB06_ZIZPA|nr:hypothetical protein GUJ93_ZPchr0014g47019 [Zizania palustris]